MSEKVIKSLPGIDQSAAGQRSTTELNNRDDKWDKLPNTADVVNMYFCLLTSPVHLLNEDQ